MMEAIERHLDRSNQDPNSEENINKGREAIIRCIGYVSARVKGT